MSLKILAGSLARYRLPVTLEQCREHLAGCHNRLALLELYRDYFPQNWQSSETSLELPPGQEQGYTPKELEFLNLCQTLFPFSADYLEELAEEGEYSLEIPVYSLEIDWYNTEPADFAPWLQMMLLLAGCATPEKLELPDQCLAVLAELNLEVAVAQDKYRLRQPDPYLRSSPGREDVAEDWFIHFDGEEKGLRESCGMREDLLVHLPLALDAIFHQTGCAMLDATDEAGIEAYWDRENLDWLVQETRLAEDTLKKIEELGSWLLADPAHLREVFELWQELYRLLPEGHQTVTGKEEIDD